MIGIESLKSVQRIKGLTIGLMILLAVAGAWLTWRMWWLTSWIGALIEESSGELDGPSDDLQNQLMQVTEQIKVIHIGVGITVLLIEAGLMVIGLSLRRVHGSPLKNPSQERNC